MGLTMIGCLLLAFFWMFLDMAEKAPTIEDAED